MATYVIKKLSFQKEQKEGVRAQGTDTKVAQEKQLVELIITGGEIHMASRKEMILLADDK